jgi:LmbE family N-acetylglucosaminyl deacetylase
MEHILISPHPDDAVLSCYTLLTAPGRFRGFCDGDGAEAGDSVHVINVFAGLPPRNMTTSWDRECHAKSSWAQVHRRIGEDAEIMAGLGLPSYYLDELDSQYRPDGPEPDISRIAQSINDLVEVDERSIVWIPWSRHDDGRPTHDDHVIARAAGELLAGDTGSGVRYYADLPYLRSAAFTNPSASNSTLTILPMRAERAKLAAWRQYETQWRYLDAQWRMIKNERYLKP